MQDSLSTNLSNFDLFDWDSLLTTIKSNIILERTKNLFDDEKIPKKNSEIVTNYNRLTSFSQILDNSEINLNFIFSRIPLEHSNLLFVKKISKHDVLTTDELHFVCCLIESFLSLKRLFFSANFWNHDSGRLDLLKNKVLVPSRALLGEKGEILFHSHPELRKLFYKIENVERTIRESLAYLIKSDDYVKALQYTEFDILNDHFVLAVKSDSYNKKLGSIVARSNTGHTLFVEPFSIRTLVEDRIQLLNEVNEIIHRFLSQATQVLSELFDIFQDVVDSIVELDLLNARMKTNDQFKLIRPNITDDNTLELRGFFHPLITNPIKNDLVLENNDSGLVISGANTGGKTVILKTLALCHLFPHYGLYVPASYAKINPEFKVYYFGNDGQNLLTGLSSFAAEVKAYVEMISGLSGKNIIFIDEIFNSTSSEEASSLALGIFDEIIKRSNSKILVSTHHQLLKTLIHARKTFKSAHVGFDAKTFSPTYKLHVGEPGNSMALEIFNNVSQNYSFKSDIAEKAREILGEKHQIYEKLLQELHEEKEKYRKLTIEQKQITIHLRNQQRASDGVLRLERDKILSNYHEDFKSIIKKAKSLLSKSKHGEISENSLREQSYALSQAFDSRDENAQVDAFLPLALEDAIPGKRIYSIDLKKHGEILSYDTRKKMVLTTINGKKISLPIQRLSLSSKPLEKKDLPTSIIISTNEKIECDWRGLRLDEVQSLFDQVVLSLRSKQIPFCNIIHGHGDGILKSWIREALAEYSDLQYEIPDGNDGNTKIFLR